MNYADFLLDTLPEKVNPKWIKKIEVLKSEKEKYIYGNGIILIYPKKRYFRQISLILETVPDDKKRL
jgi:hypothetical protein